MLNIKVVIKKKLIMYMIVIFVVFFLIMIRLFYIHVFMSEFLQEKAYDQQTRNRGIIPKRGMILDRNNNILAESISVNTIYVINSQIKDHVKVAKILSEKLDLNYEDTLRKVNKKLAVQKIKSKVDRKMANEIRNENLDGVIIDEDFKRYYPYSNLASQVIGFCGSDTQGIIGAEVKYDKYLKGAKGNILLPTDVNGKKIGNMSEVRIKPEDGNNLVLTIDSIIQKYAEQVIEKVLEQKQAKRVSIIIMNPQNGEILAMANKPDFDLNNPFELKDKEFGGVWAEISREKRNEILNKRWRNFTINDTYEPGSTFKTITSASALNEKVVSIDDRFYCRGFAIAGDRKIKCWYYPRAHGSETFLEGVKNSCNPVFIETSARLGKDKFYKYLDEFGFREKTGIDLPGEAKGILHNVKKVGPVELAVTSFGQSFQITPLQLVRAASATINGGYLVTPHIGKKIVSNNNIVQKEFVYKKGKSVINKDTSDTMRYILEQVVQDGTGHNAYIPGYRIGGKTATSEKLPRRTGRYISSFLGFAPADNPQIIALVLIDEPQGLYYGGVIAAPVIKEVFENVLPYLGIEPRYSEEELKKEKVKQLKVPLIVGEKVSKCRNNLRRLGFKYKIIGNGNIIIKQFPLPNELINEGEEILIYTD